MKGKVKRQTKQAAPPPSGAAPFVPHQSCRVCGKKLYSRREGGARVFVAPGDGYFCSQAHGYQWAVAMVKALEKGLEGGKPNA